MGVYIYTMRSKTVSLYLPTGEKVAANLYSYAYKLYNPWPGDYGYASYKRTEANAERHARNAFTEPRSGYVIIGDLGDGRTKLESHSVYTNVAEPLWYDCEKFPGTMLGFVGVRGRQLVLTDTTNWSECKSLREDGQWVPMRSRSRMVEGKVKHEQEELPCNQDSAIS